MKVGITGATGFVGSHLCPTLETLGLLVERIGRPYGGIDIQLDAVVHLAGKAHAHGSEVAEYETANVHNTNDAIELARRSGAKKFILLSTSKVFGESSGGTPLDGASPVNPIGPYAETKLRGEELVREKLDGLDVVILRPPVIYGSDVKGNLGLVENLLRRGIPLPLFASKRSYLSVDRLVRVMHALLEAPSQPGCRTLVVTDGAAVQTDQLFRSLAESQGRTARLVPIPAFGAALLGWFDQRFLGSRFAAVLNDFVLDPADIADALPGLAEVNTLAEISTSDG